MSPSLSRSSSKVFLSSVPQKARGNQFVKDRKVYQQELTSLRKVWQVEFEVIRKREEAQRIAERKRIVIEKAIRLRDIRAEQLRVQERVKKEREAARLRYLGIRERNTLIVNQRREEQQQRYSMLVEDLARESACWVTLDNVNDKICEDLFKSQCTTGFVSRKSQLWRYEAVAVNFRRPEAYDEDDIPSSTPLAADDHTETGDMEADALHDQLQSELAKKTMVKQFLRPMIETGTQRAEIERIVNEFTSTFEQLGTFQNLVDDFDPNKPKIMYCSDLDEDDEDEDEEETATIAKSTEDLRARRNWSSVDGERAAKSEASSELQRQVARAKKAAAAAKFKSDMGTGSK